ncbi:MAG: hypothetical protein V4446_12335 [Pseudomonadota bacterium]
MHVRRLHPLFALTLALCLMLTQRALAVRGMGRTGGLIAAYGIGVSVMRSASPPPRGSIGSPVL